MAIHKHQYAAKLQGYGMVIPCVHVIVGNRLAQYEGVAGAFSALSDATADTLYQAFTGTLITASPKRGTRPLWLLTPLANGCWLMSSCRATPL